MTFFFSDGVFVFSSFQLYHYPALNHSSSTCYSGPGMYHVTLLPFFGKRKQVTYHLNLNYWCFCILPSVLFFQANFMHQHSSCLDKCWVRHLDIPLTSVEMTDKFCSFTGNVNSVTCFLLPKQGSLQQYLLSSWPWKICELAASVH